jgi:hypothetical protein
MTFTLAFKDFVLIDMSKPTHQLILVVIVLIAIVYLRYFVSVNPEFDLLQVPVSKLTPSLLFEKSPVLIEDRTVHPNALAETAFKWLYVKRKVDAVYNATMPQNNNTYTIAMSRYTLLYADQDACIVRLAHPSFKNKKGDYTKLVDIRLAQNQTLIVPRGWAYKLQGSYVVIHLDSLSSLILKWLKF